MSIDDRGGTPSHGAVESGRPERARGRPRFDAMSHRRIPEDEARKILDRALLLDRAERSGLTVDELRHMASEMGVAPAALERALRDVAPDRDEGRDQSRETWDEGFTAAFSWRLPGWPRRALIGAPAFLWGILARVMDDGLGDEALVAMVGAVFGAVLALVMHHRRKGTLLGFQLDTFSLWAAFAVGYLVVYGRVLDDVVSSVAGFWTGSALVGGAIVSWWARRWDREPTVDDDPRDVTGQ